MSIRLSVIICTHNPREDYLTKTLEGLKTQTAEFASWELIVIDNNSSTALRGRVDLSWHPNGRIVEETNLGLTPARLRGIKEAGGDLLIFVDDDNVLDPDYLVVAMQISDERPFLGSWSGQCRPTFDQAPPEWTRPYWGNLVIREFKEDRWSNLPLLADTLPCGAGMCVRKEVALYYLKLIETGKRPFQLDRTGKSLVSGGDGDLAACACDLKLGVGICADLKLQHLIPPNRLTVEYLSKLTEGIYFSAVVLECMRGSTERLNRWQVRPREWLQAFTCRGNHRRIRWASLQGRARGVEWVQENIQ